MLSVVNVAIHSSQTPENIQRALRHSLRTRRINHQFHYDSVQQTNQWLALHQVYSPSRNDADCAATYNRAFAAGADQIRSRAVHLIGLGCGGGQKDTRLLRRLRARGKQLSYAPVDVSTAMVLVAHQTARAVLPPENLFPLVCDLAVARDLPAVLETPAAPRAARLITFFGMIPNFEPEKILPQLSQLVRRQDRLLFSANLAPGANYAQGMRRILPQYDNPLTREWLLTFLLHLGVARTDGEIKFRIERGITGLQRVVAHFHFRRARRITVAGETIPFPRGTKVRLFFSYRYTPELAQRHLAKVGLRVRTQWVTRSGEEGVFLCERQ